MQSLHKRFLREHSRKGDILSQIFRAQASTDDKKVDLTLDTQQLLASAAAPVDISGCQGNRRMLVAIDKEVLDHSVEHWGDFSTRSVLRADLGEFSV